jgi:hypothetical protein
MGVLGVLRTPNTPTSSPMSRQFPESQKIHKTARLYAGSFFGGGEKKFVRLFKLLTNNMIVPEREQ